MCLVWGRATPSGDRGLNQRIQWCMRYRMSGESGRTQVFGPNGAKGNADLHYGG